jgi:hypothetical protein
VNSNFGNYPQNHSKSKTVNDCYVNEFGCGFIKASDDHHLRDLMLRKTKLDRWYFSGTEMPELWSDKTLRYRMRS